MHLEKKTKKNKKNKKKKTMDLVISKCRIETNSNFDTTYSYYSAFCIYTQRLCVLPLCQHSLSRNCYFYKTQQDPVVQSIVSLTISLRHKFVKQISAKVTNTLLFFVEKM